MESGQGAWVTSLMMNGSIRTRWRLAYNPFAIFYPLPRDHPGFLRLLYQHEKINVTGNFNVA